MTLILKTQIQEMAANFADAVFTMLSSQALGALLGDDPKRALKVAPSLLGSTRREPPVAGTKRRGRLARRSHEEIAEIIGKVVDLLRRSPQGLRAENIRENFGLAPNEMPRIIKEGLATKAFTVLHGHKRSTTYGLKAAKTVKSAKTVKAAARSGKATSRTTKAAKATKTVKAKPTRAKAKPAKAKPKKTPRAPKAAPETSTANGLATASAEE